MSDIAATTTTTETTTPTPAPKETCKKRPVIVSLPPKKHHPPEVKETVQWNDDCKLTHVQQNHSWAEGTVPGPEPPCHFCAAHHHHPRPHNTDIIEPVSTLFLHQVYNLSIS